MGIDYSIYIGPYLSCKFHMEKRETERFVCSKCNETIKSNFCPNDGGAAVTQLSTMETPSVEYYNDIDGIDIDVFCELHGGWGDGGLKDREHWLSPNSTKFGDRPLYFDMRDTGLLASEPDVEKECQLLVEKHKKEIECLRKVYDSVEIKWGVISSAN